MYKIMIGAIPLSVKEHLPSTVADPRISLNGAHDPGFG